MPWGDLVIIGQKVNQQPIPGKWKDRIGKYRYHEAFGNTGPVEMARDLMDDYTAYVLGVCQGGGKSFILKTILL